MACILVQGFYNGYFFHWFKFLVVFTIARPLFTQIIFSHGFILFKDVIEMGVNNFLVGVLFFVIIMMVAFSIQSEINEIL